MSWTQEEELKLINLIKEKKSYDDIALILSKEKKALIFRLQKIIYENKKSGKNFEIISFITGLPIEDVIYNYQEYKNLIDDNREKKEIKIMREYKENKNNDWVDEKIKVLERENKFIKLILENKALQKKINLLIEHNKLNKNIIDVIKKMRKE